MYTLLFLQVKKKLFICFWAAANLNVGLCFIAAVSSQLMHKTMFNAIVYAAIHLK